MLQNSLFLAAPTAQRVLMKILHFVLDGKKENKDVIIFSRVYDSVFCIRMRKESLVFNGKRKETQIYY
jgi:hypothetical protein